MFILAQHVNERQRALRGLGMFFRPSERVRYLRGLGQVQELPSSTWNWPSTADIVAEEALLPAAYGGTEDVGVPAGYAVTSTGAVAAVKPTATQQQGAPMFSQQWMEAEMIPGVKNKYLVLGTAGVFFVTALKKKKKR